MMVLYDERIETVKRFLRMRKFSYDDIAAGSGLSIKEVEELADELQIV